MKIFPWLAKHPFAPGTFHKGEGPDIVTPIVNYAVWIVVPVCLLILFLRRK